MMRPMAVHRQEHRSLHVLPRWRLRPEKEAADPRARSFLTAGRAVRVPPPGAMEPFCELRVPSSLWEGPGG